MPELNGLNVKPDIEFDKLGFTYDPATNSFGSALIVSIEDKVYVSLQEHQIKKLRDYLDKICP